MERRGSQWLSWSRLFVDRFGMYVSQMTTDMFILS